MTHFTKNEAVTLIAPWNSLGDFYTRACIVHSCGKKRLLLKDATTGITLKTQYDPRERQISNSNMLVMRVECDTTAAAHDEMMLYRAHKIYRIEDSIERGVNDSGYVKEMQKTLAKIKAHTPTVATYAERHAAL